MRLRIIASITFVCGLVLFTTSIVSSRKAASQPSPQSQSFVIDYLVYQAEEGGTLKLTSYQERVVSATGEWKETRRSIEGKVTTLAGTSEGLFIVNEKEQSKQLYGPSSAQGATGQTGSADMLKNHPLLVRTEELAGRKAYILKPPGGRMEMGYAPETGQTLLKEVIFSSPESDSIIFIKEAVKIEFREVSEDELKTPDLPIRFDLANEKLKALRESGRQDAADSLQRLIDKYKDK